MSGLRLHVVGALLALVAPAAAEGIADRPVDPEELPAAAPLMSRADRVKGDEAPGMVAFTFDDGPSPKTTPIILRALAKHRVPATFFVVNRHLHGKRGAAGLPILARILADGHQIGGHTANHVRLRKTNEQLLSREIDNALELLERASGRPVELFRPPYGIMGESAEAHLVELGLTDVRWSVDPQDFHGADPAQLRANVLASLVDEGGGVVLLHDTKRNTAACLDDLLSDLARMNCRRMRRAQEPLLPVSLHYFLRDRGTPRPIPPEVAARTAAYRLYLEELCNAETSPEPHKEAPLAAAAQESPPKAKPRKKRRRARGNAAPSTASAPATGTLRDL